MDFRVNHVRNGSVDEAYIRPPKTKATSRVTHLQNHSLKQVTRLKLRHNNLLNRHNSLIKRTNRLTNSSPRLILNRGMVFLLHVNVLMIPHVRQVRRIMRDDKAILTREFRLRQDNILKTLRRISLIVSLNRLLTRNNLHYVTMSLDRHYTYQGTFTIYRRVSRHTTTHGMAFLGRRRTFNVRNILRHDRRNNLMNVKQG